MASVTIPKFNLRDISKWPLAFLCVVMIWLVREFMFRNNQTTQEHVMALNSQVSDLTKSNLRKDTVIAFWQAKYIREVEKNATYFKTQDSANRAALEKPAKDILKIVKQHKNEQAF